MIGAVDAIVDIVDIVVATLSEIVDGSTQNELLLSGEQTVGDLHWTVLVPLGRINGVKIIAVGKQ